MVFLAELFSQPFRTVGRLRPPWEEVTYSPHRGTGRKLRSAARTDPAVSAIEAVEKVARLPCGCDAYPTGRGRWSQPISGRVGRIQLVRAGGPRASDEIVYQTAPVRVIVRWRAAVALTK